MSILIKNQVAVHIVDLSDIDSRIQLDIRYATIKNFLGLAVYSKAVCYLHRRVAEALSRVQDELELFGLFLKVYDGYRPLLVQQFMWDIIQDEKYVANPAKNKGRHTRGTAVDLTLVDHQGHEIEMPTDFDDFTEKARSDFMDVSKQALQNRTLLQIMMKKNGFHPIRSEWWHFDFNGWNDDILYPPLSLSFEEIEAIHSQDSPFMFKFF